MTERRIGIIMHGVTGRMGTNQHLVRSILAIREEGGIVLADGTRVLPEPILVGRDPRKLEQLADRYGLARWTLDLEAALADHRRRDLLRCRLDQASRRPDPARDRRRQARLLREARRRDSRGCAAHLARRARCRHPARRRPGQALAAGPSQAENADRCRLLRPHPVGQGRLRLLGVRGPLAGGAAAVLELSQGPGRRHHPGYALPLALRARQPVRRGQGRRAAWAPTTSPSASTSRAGATTPMPTMRPMRSSSSKAASSPSSTAHGARACGATTF